MKKTLITVALAVAPLLSALADEASITLPEPVYSNSDVTAAISASGTYATSNGDRKTFTLMAVYDWSELEEAITSTTSAHSIFLCETAQKEYNSKIIAFRVNEGADNALEAVFIKKNSTKEEYIELGSAIIQDVYTPQDKIVLTLVYDSTGSTLYGYDARSDSMKTLITSTDTTGQGYSGLISRDAFTGILTGAYVYDTNLSSDQLLVASRAAYAAAIPEPATATLSLLALAGLCARRRRK